MNENHQAHEPREGVAQAGRFLPALLAVGGFGVRSVTRPHVETQSQLVKMLFT